MADVLTKPIGPASYWRLLSVPLYGRDRATKGELTEVTATTPVLAKPTPGEGPPSFTYNNFRYRMQVTLYVESQDSPGEVFVGGTTFSGTISNQSGNEEYGNQEGTGIENATELVESERRNLFCSACGMTRNT